MLKSKYFMIVMILTCLMLGAGVHHLTGALGKFGQTLIEVSVLLVGEGRSGKLVSYLFGSAVAVEFNG